MQSGTGAGMPCLDIRYSHEAPYEHDGCFCYGDLDCFPPLLPLKSPYLSLKLILYGLTLLNLILRLHYLLLSLIEADSLLEGTGTGLP